MNRQKQILTVLLIILALVGLRAYFSTSPPAQIDDSGDYQATVSRSERTGPDSKSAVDPLRVKLDLLELEKKKYKGYKRDIFNFYQPPPPKPVARPVRKPVENPAPVVKPPPVVTPLVRQQLAKFTFLGFLVKEEQRTVFLSKRDELFLVRNADFFGEDNQFEVLAITEEKLTIRQNGASEQIEIELIEKEPLIPSFSPGEVSGQTGGSPGVRKSSPAARRSSVPPQEQRKTWFKKAQPPANE